MTYIFEMASGKEFMGDEVASPSTAKAFGAPHISADHCVEPRLATLEASAPDVHDYPAELYLEHMISKLED
jgi:hypothetical protein